MSHTGFMEPTLFENAKAIAAATAKGGGRRFRKLREAAAAKATLEEEGRVKRRPAIELPEGYEYEDGFKSRERVNAIAEVLTAEREVKAMLDLVDEPVRDADSRVLEPACGNGNFLVEILRRKLESINVGVQEQEDFEFNILTAVTHIYGIDIQQDNVSEAHDRLCELIACFYSSKGANRTPKEGFLDSVNHVLRTNIICGDSWHGQHQIRIVEYSSPFRYKFTPRYFQLSEITRPTGHFPKPFKILDTIHYLRLHDAD